MSVLLILPFVDNIPFLTIPKIWLSVLAIFCNALSSICMRRLYACATGRKHTGIRQSYIRPVSEKQLEKIPSPISAEQFDRTGCKEKNQIGSGRKKLLWISFEIIKEHKEKLWSLSINFNIDKLGCDCKITPLLVNLRYAWRIRLSILT